MKMHLYDTEVENPFAATVHHIDYDYQAEMWVEELADDPMTTNPKRWVVKWELVDDEGVRARWERPDGSRGVPRLTFTAPRYGGEWRAGT
jgi:hypothetical protein